MVVVIYIYIYVCMYVYIHTCICNFICIYRRYDHARRLIHDARQIEIERGTRVDQDVPLWVRRPFSRLFSFAPMVYSWDDTRHGRCTIVTEYM